MTRVTDAIFADGVLRPIEPLGLREQERVRIIIETIERPSDEQRRAALQRFRQRIEAMKFRHGGPYGVRS